jgi:hypothetical protein
MRRRYVLVAAVGMSVGALLALTVGAFAATGTLSMGAGDSEHVTCGGPVLSVGNQTGTALDLNCAPNPTTSTTTAPPPAAGVLQIDPSAPPRVTGDTNNTGAPITLTSASFSPPANAVIVLGFTINNYAPASYYDTTMDPGHVTNSGSPLVWTKQVGSDWPASGTEGGSETWTATTGSTAPGPITITAVGSEELQSNVDWMTMVIQVVTDSDGTAPVVGVAGAAAHTGGLPSVTVNLSPGSLGFAAVADWSSNSSTPGFGPGLIAVENGRSPPIQNNPPDYAWHYFRSAAGSVGGPTTFNMTAPSQTWNETVVEVRPG